MSSLLDLLGGSGTKSLKEAASRALDTSVACVPPRLKKSGSAPVHANQLCVFVCLFFFLASIHEVMPVDAHLVKFLFDLWFHFVFIGTCCQPCYLLPRTGTKTCKLPRSGSCTQAAKDCANWPPQKPQKLVATPTVPREVVVAVVEVAMVVAAVAL